MTKLLRSRPATPALHANRPGSSERFFGRNKQLNASSRKDARQTLSALIAAVENGEVVMDEEEGEPEITVEEKNKIVTAAYHKRNPGDKDWAKMGQSLAAEVYQVAARQGFFRQLMRRVDLAGANRPEIQINENNITAVVMTTPSMLAPQFPVDKYIYPPEFSIQANLRVSELDIARAQGDILDQRYNEGLEAVMVTEDRAWKQMVDSIAGVVQPSITVSGNLTPANIAYMRQLLIDEGLQPTNVVMSTTYINDFLVTEAFQNLYDDVTKYNILQTGNLGNFFGLNFMTDALRRKNLRVLDAGDFYMTAAPEDHGAYTDRGPVQAVPVDNYPEGLAARGWFIWEFMSMAIVNPASVIKARRA